MIYKYYSHFKFFLLMLFGLISSAEGIILSYIVGTLTDIATQKSYSRIPTFILISGCFLIIVFISQVFFNFLKTDAIKNINIYLRTNIFKGMLNDSKESKDGALGFLTNDFKLLETNRFGAEISIIINIFTLLLALCYSLYLNWLLTLVFLLGSVVPVIISSFFQKPIQKSADFWSRANKKYVNQTKNFLEGSDTIRLYNGQDQSVSKNQKKVKELESKLGKMNLLDLNTNSYINIFANVFSFLLPFLTGILLVIHESTTIGTLFAVIQISNSFVNPILNILNERNNLSTTKNIVEEVNCYLDLAKVQSIKEPKNFKSLKIEGLSLKRHNQELATNIDIEIEKGDKIALIGPSGSGKSTLLQFLMYGDCGTSKEILLNDIPREPGSFTGLFAFSEQKANIFSDDIWFNLTLGSDISQEIVNELCDNLGLKQMINVKGYDYLLGDNADKLSGGQLARIELARAILSSRPILLLDEINASLDKKTDDDIHRYLFDSNETFIETIHHYDSKKLKQYNKVINLSNYLINKGLSFYYSVPF